jgi:hypothetical protein
MYFKEGDGWGVAKYIGLHKVKPLKAYLNRVILKQLKMYFCSNNCPCLFMELYCSVSFSKEIIWSAAE